MFERRGELDHKTELEVVEKKETGELDGGDNEKETLLRLFAIDLDFRRDGARTRSTVASNRTRFLTERQVLETEKLLSLPGR